MHGNAGGYMGYADSSLYLIFSLPSRTAAAIKLHHYIPFLYHPPSPAGKNDPVSSNSATFRGLPLVKRVIIWPIV